MGHRNLFSIEADNAIHVARAMVAKFYRYFNEVNNGQIIKY
jgi:hypothetical protein